MDATDALRDAYFSFDCALSALRRVTAHGSNSAFPDPNDDVFTAAHELVQAGNRALNAAAVLASLPDTDLRPQTFLDRIFRKLFG